MKRNSKILAVVIVLAMVMSMMVMPATVSAAWSYEAENLFSEITEASGKTVKSTTVSALNANGQTSWVYYNKTSGTADHSVDLQSDGSVLVSGRNDAEDGIRQTYAELYTGHKYLASARVKLAAGSTEQGNFEITVGKAGAIDGKTNWINSITSNATAKTVKSDGWYYVYNLFTVNAVSGATTETHRENGAHVAFKLPGVTSGETTTFANYYIRDLKLVDVTDGINLAHTRDADLESGTASGLTKDSKATVEVNTTAKRNGTYGASLTAYRADNNSVRIVSIPKTDGVWYRATVWAKLASESDSNTAYMLASENGAACTTCKDSADTWAGNNVELSATEWKPVYVDFKTAAYECTGNEGVCYNNTTKIVRNQIHFGPRFKTADVPVYLDDFSIEQFTPAAFTATLTEGTITTDSAEINVSFSSAPVSFTEANVTVDGATVAVEKLTDTSYKIKLTDLEDGTEYNVSLTNVTDIYSQTATGTIAVETEEIPEVIPPAPVSTAVVANSISQAASRTGHVITKVEDGHWTVVKDSERLTDNVQKTGVALEAGTKYIVAAKIKNLDATPNEDATAYVTISVGGNSSHTIVAATNVERFKIDDGEWHNIWGVIDISATTCDGKDSGSYVCSDGTCDRTQSTGHFGVATNEKNTSFEVMDIKLIPLKTLAYDESYGAVVADNGDGTASLYVTNATATTVYFAAASYNQDGSLADVKFGSASADANGGLIEIDVPENYKVMIWDANMKPLHNTFLGSDF